MAGFSTKTFLKFDDYMTPKSAWENIKNFIPKNKTIWEPFYGDGKSGEYLKSLGFKVIHQKEDFFLNNKGDIIISNPPFTIKKEILTRLKQLDKPFILIMPSSVINYKYFKDLFRDSKIQLIVPPKRIQFTKILENKEIFKGRCNFDCFYYCYKMNFDNDIIFL